MRDLERLSVGDTCWFFHLASNRWKPANFRGRSGEFVVVVYEGTSWSISPDEVSINNPEEDHA